MANGAISQTVYNAVVQACVDSGIYAIIDWHEGQGSNVTAAGTFFTTMANKWHGIPNIMYEPWNEPSNIAWTPGIKTYMETIIKIIRPIDPDNIIICGNPQWDQKPQDAAADPITGYTNIAYSMHFYSGSHPVGSYSPGITTTMGKGLPVFITEYGASNTGPWPDNVISTYGAFIKAYILKGTDTPISTGVVPYESEPQQRPSAPAAKGLLTVTEKPVVYTINGVRCSAAGKLPHGLYMMQAPGHAIVKCVNVVR
jgi:hypothetical protein